MSWGKPAGGFIKFSVVIICMEKKIQSVKIRGPPPMEITRASEAQKATVGSQVYKVLEEDIKNAPLFARTTTGVLIPIPARVYAQRGSGEWEATEENRTIRKVMSQLYGLTVVEGRVYSKR